MNAGQAVAIALEDGHLDGLEQLPLIMGRDMIGHQVHGIVHKDAGGLPLVVTGNESSHRILGRKRGNYFFGERERRNEFCPFLGPSRDESPKEVGCSLCLRVCELHHVAWPSTLVSETGVVGKCGSRSSLVGNSDCPQRFWSQPLPTSQPPSGRGFCSTKPSKAAMVSEMRKKKW